MHTAESDPDDGHQFELLACAIAGREVKIADLAPGEPAWTDGVRIHLDPSTDAEERLRTVATQASLIAAGSLEPELLRRIGRRNGLARRYLSIEGDRALRVNEVLPPALHPLLRTDPGLVATDAAHSLELARSSADVPDPPSHFGVLRAKKLLAGGIAEVVDLFERDLPEVVVARHRDRVDVAAFNLGEAPRRVAIDLARCGLAAPDADLPEFWTGRTVSLRGGIVAMGDLPAHGVAVVSLPSEGA